MSHFLSILLQTLKDDLEGDTHGDFEDLLVALVTPPAVYDCQQVIGAIKVSVAPAERPDRVGPKLCLL